MTDSLSQPRFIPGENAPMSPHLQVWKFTVTMAGSISHRITGIANAAGLLLLTAWIASAALSDAAFAAVNGFLGSWAGRAILFAFTLSVVYHLLNGIRYLFMDSGRLISKEAGSAAAWAAYLLTLPVTVAIFWAAYAAGGAQS